MKNIIAVEAEVKDTCIGCCFDGLDCPDLRKQAIDDFGVGHCMAKDIIYKEVETIGTTETITLAEEFKTPNISFNNQHNESIGTLYWEDNLMKFKGDVHESAKVLFEYVCSMWNDKEKDQMGESELRVLNFLYLRLVEMYGENSRCDYMQTFKKIIDNMENMK